MLDHFPLCTVFDTSKTARPFSKVRDNIPVTEEKFKLLNEKLENVTWDSVMKKEDLDEGFEIFHNILTSLYKACCFKQKLNKREIKNVPISRWVIKSLLRGINKKNNLWAGYCHLPSTASQVQLHQVQDLRNL